ncbi:phasin family protein [Lysobacter sp. CCNWLW3]|uniref:phasin family protein n=1 Tax=unclassified Lysobacter TaxID=2635362 RepID=UPI002FD3EAA3
MATVKRKTRAAKETTLRHLWLAGLGLVAIARRGGFDAAGRAVERADALQRRAQKLVRQTRENLRAQLDSVRGQVEPRVVKFSAEVETRLAPVLDKLGLKPKAQRKTRKPAAKAKKKPAPVRRAVRKPAKRAARKA